MRTFLMLYASGSETDDDCIPYKPGKSLTSERRSFTLLSSVCKCFWKTLSGWPESPTGHWVRHQLRTVIERKYTQYRPKPSSNTCGVSLVWHMYDMLQNSLMFLVLSTQTTSVTDRQRNDSIAEQAVQCTRQTPIEHGLKQREKILARRNLDSGSSQYLGPGA